MSLIMAHRQPLRADIYLPLLLKAQEIDQVLWQYLDPPLKKQRFLASDWQILISDMDQLTVKEPLMEPMADKTLIPKSSK